MKKVFSILFVAAALLAVSCGGNTTPAETEVTEVEVVDVVADSTACACADSTACAGCAEGEACACTAEVVAE